MDRTNPSSPLPSKQWSTQAGPPGTGAGVWEPLCQGGRAHSHETVGSGMKKGVKEMGKPPAKENREPRELTGVDHTIGNAMSAGLEGRGLEKLFRGCMTVSEPVSGSQAWPSRSLYCAGVHSSMHLLMPATLS